MNSFRRGTSGQGYRCSGLTLIELMVAMVLSLVLMGGVLTLFASSKTSFRLQSGLAALQENGRYALQTMVRDIRAAGFVGCAGAGPTILTVKASPPPANINAIIGGEIVSGGTAGPVQNPYGAALGTDWIRVSGGGSPVASLVGQTAPNNANIQTTPIQMPVESGQLMVLTDCESMDLFCAGGVNTKATTISHPSSCNTDAKLSRGYGGDASLLKFFSNVYFVKVTGRTNAVGNPIMSLWRLDESKPGATPADAIELVEGVEDMQIDYGFDGDGNGFVDQFIDAPASGSDDWEKVRAVRISLLVSSVENSHSEPVPYNYVGVSSTPVDPTDFKLRQEMASTVTIRNRVN